MLQFAKNKMVQMLSFQPFFLFYFDMEVGQLISDFFLTGVFVVKVNSQSKILRHFLCRHEDLPKHQFISLFMKGYKGFKSVQASIQPYPWLGLLESRSLLQFCLGLSLDKSTIVSVPSVSPSSKAETRGPRVDSLNPRYCISNQT